MTKWLQELGSWDIIPDPVMRGTIDDVTWGIHIGAMQHSDPIREPQTICMWWNQQALPHFMLEIFKQVTGMQKPGRSRRALLWTTNPQHELRTSNPMMVNEVTTKALACILHLPHNAHLLGVTRGEWIQMQVNASAILIDAFESGVTSFPCLEEIGFYDRYEKEVLGR